LKINHQPYSIFGDWHWSHDGWLRTGTGIPVINSSLISFLTFFCQAGGLYEGTPLYPKLFSNAREKQTFQKIQTSVLIGVSLICICFAPLCVLAYGNNLRDTVLLNLDYGTFEQCLQGLYCLCFIYNITLNISPVFDIFLGFKKKIEKDLRPNLF
jgi:hypothetical protein